MTMMLGVPLKLLKEFTNRKLTVETSNGASYRGILIEAEDNMSLSLSNVKATLPDGSNTEMTNVYIKGSRIRLINLPESAKDSLSSLTRAPAFRGGRGGGFRGGRGLRRGGFSKPSYDRRRY